MVSPAPSPAWAAGPPATAWDRLAPELLPLLGLIEDAQEGRGSDVHGGGGLPGLDLVGDAGGLIDRDGEALAAGGPEGEPGRGGGVDTDHVALGVDQGATRVAGLDIGVDLDEAGELFAAAVALVGGGDRLVESGDGASGAAGRAADAARVAQPHDLIADRNLRGIADGRRREALAPCSCSTAMSWARS